MKTKSLLLTALLLMTGIASFAQDNVAINTSGASPDGSAMLDITSTDKGLLIPRMTTSQRTGISSPATGLMVYDTDENSFWYYDGGSWAEVGGSSGGGGFTAIEVFDASTSWTVPNGITTIMVEVWGAGGAAYYCGSPSNIEGGGGGGYSKGFFSVVPGTNYTITVGTGADFVWSSSLCTNLPAGGNSSFGTLISATGGSSGHSSNGPGAGGTGSGGTINIKGGYGNSAGPTGGVSQQGQAAGGDAGGPGGQGGSGREGGSATAPNFNGNIPGGGGTAAGDGAKGRVIVYY